MKNAIASIVTAVLMTLSFSSFAIAPRTNPLKVKEAKEILLTYVEAVSVGSTDLNNYIFSDDFQYESATDNKKYNKKVYLDYLKKNKGLVYQCETNSQILDQTGDTALAKTTLKFATFSRVDHISLIRTTDGWKVNKVVTSYL